jgi:hypothetical protein
MGARRDHTFASVSGRTVKKIAKVTHQFSSQRARHRQLRRGRPKACLWAGCDRRVPKVAFEVDDLVLLFARKEFRLSSQREIMWHAIQANASLDIIFQFSLQVAITRRSCGGDLEREALVVLEGGTTVETGRILRRS